MTIYTIRVLKKSRRCKKCSYPAAKWTPYGDASAKVPQDPDDDDAGAQPVGSGLGTQAGAGGRGREGRRGMRRNSSSNQRGERRDVRLHTASHEKRKKKKKKTQKRKNANRLWKDQQLRNY